MKPPNVHLPAGNYISLFAGCAGFDLGLRIACPDARCVGYVEIGIETDQVLASRIKDGSLDVAPIWTDVRTFDGRRRRGQVDGIIGGFPCQDLSVAGKRAGLKGRRSGLWGEYERLIEEIQPSWVVIENVGGLLSSLTLLHRSDILGHFDALLAAAESPKERWYAQSHIDRLERRLLPIYGMPALLYVQACLGKMGYESEAGLFTATEVGASHDRLRVFILAHRQSGAGDRMADAGDGLLSQPWRGPEGRDGPGSTEPVLADPNKRNDDRSGNRGKGRRRESSDINSQLGNSDIPRLEGRNECGHSTGERITGAAGGELADAGCKCDERRREPGELGSAGENPESETQEREWGGDSTCYSLPLFAPGPGATELWQRILTDYPHLAPAISEEEIESALCGMADGMARMVADERTDALRAIGNGVVALQAAVAITILGRRLSQ